MFLRKSEWRHILCCSFYFWKNNSCTQQNHRVCVKDVIWPIVAKGLLHAVSLTSTFWEKTRWSSGFSTCMHNPIIHLFYPAPPPKKSCIIISLGHEDVPREIENNAYAIFFLGGGGGEEVYYGICASREFGWSLEINYNDQFCPKMLKINETGCNRSFANIVHVTSFSQTWSKRATSRKNTSPQNITSHNHNSFAIVKSR